MFNNKSVIFFALLFISTIFATALLVFYLLSQNTISNPFTKISGTIEPDDEAIFLLSDTENLTHTFWRVGKDGNEVKPFHKFINELQLDSITVSPNNSKIAATNLFNPVFIYIIDLESKKEYRLNYGNPYDRNSNSVNTFIWIDDDSLLFNITDPYIQEISSNYNRVDFNNNDNYEITQINCPVLNINYGKPKVALDPVLNTIYYFTGNDEADLVSCNITTGEIDTTFNIRSNSLIEWFLSNGRIIVVENEIKGGGNYQNISHKIITYNLTTREINSTNLGGEYYKYNTDNSGTLFFTDDQGLCVYSVDIDNEAKNEELCNSQYTNYLSVGNYIYYTSNNSEPTKSILSRYDTNSDLLTQIDIPSTYTIEDFNLLQN